MTHRMSRQPEPSSRPARHPPMRRLPVWLKRPLPSGGAVAETARSVRDSGVATVCREARCPNRGECWSHGVVTFMILGDVCTRDCRFCAVRHGKPGPADANEPARLATSAAELGARHVVITSVTRDDLDDEGAAQFAASVLAVRERLPGASVEVLPPDMHAREDCIATVCEAGPVVFNHNLETVRRLTPAIRPQADYERSLAVLRLAKRCRLDLLTKSGLMLGMGESRAEIGEALADLRAVACDIVTIGQYLQPSPLHWPVDRYWTPEEFEAVAEEARGLGFAAVVAGPFVRSSYNAAEAFEEVRAKRSSFSERPASVPSSEPARSGGDGRGVQEKTDRAEDREKTDRAEDSPALKGRREREGAERVPLKGCL